MNYTIFDKLRLTKTTTLFLLKYTLIALAMVNSQWVLAQQKSLHQDDWELAVQAWTFHLYTFSEALDKIDSCGVKYVEGFPNQQIGGGVEGMMDYHMDESTRQKVLDMLRAKGIQMVSYGVVKPKTDSDWEQLFKFAKAS